MRSPAPFLLLSLLCLLTVGCAKSEPTPQEQLEEFSFTAEDVERFRELARRGTGALGVPHLELSEDQQGPPVLDLSLVDTYNAIREDASQKDEDEVFRVTNEFLNVRSEPRVTAEQVERLDRGDTVKLLEFINAAWAKVKLPSGKEGYIASQYIAKLTTEAKLSEDKKKYDGLYFVNFGFLNVRKTPDTSGEKLGELPGQAFVRPLSMDTTWARVPFGDADGYVAVEYLEPFLPNFLVRQNEYHLPFLHYSLVQDGMIEALTMHVERLRKEGFKFITVRDFYAVLLRQEERDTRLDPKQVVLAISGITPENIAVLSDALSVNGARATLFLETKRLGIDGITEKTVLTLMANGHDLQSATHSGEDLRSLTNAQVELEMAQSRELLERMTKKPVFAVLYPQGGVNDRVAAKASEAGYLIGISAAEDTHFQREQLLRLPSVGVRNSTTGEEILQLVQ